MDFPFRAHSSSDSFIGLFGYLTGLSNTPLALFLGVQLHVIGENTDDLGGMKTGTPCC